MPYPVELCLAAKTDTGLVRLHNEDTIAHNLEYGIVILADGMGGYNAGEVASAIAASTVEETLLRQLQDHARNTLPQHDGTMQQLLIESVTRANLAILESARREPAFHGMGTTLVAGIFHQDRLTVAHVGDSRAYRLRGGELSLITRDHSLLQEQIEAGLVDPEWARFSSQGNLITRAVGVEPHIDVEVHEHETRAGDRYLLCSDGLSDMLSTQEIGDILNDPEYTMELTCEALVARANRNGGRDNISVILIQVGPSLAPAEGLPERLLNWVADKTNVLWRLKKALVK